MPRKLRSIKVVLCNEKDDSLQMWIHVPILVEMLEKITELSLLDARVNTLRYQESKLAFLVLVKMLDCFSEVSGKEHIVGCGIDLVIFSSYHWAFGRLVLFLVVESKHLSGCISTLLVDCMLAKFIQVFIAIGFPHSLQILGSAILFMKLDQVEIRIAEQGVEHADCEELVPHLHAIRRV